MAQVLGMTELLIYLKLVSGSNVDTTRLTIDRNTGDISFYEDTGTTAKLFWDASAESLGIGTSSPAVKFDVNGDGLQIRLDGTANTSRGIMLRNTGQRKGKFKQTEICTSFKKMLIAICGLSTANTERMRIASNGAVLVGKTSGTAGNKIETNGRISAAAGSDSLPTFNCEGDTNTGINLPEADRIQFITGGTERMRIASSGFVGIGTDSPATRLEIKDGNNTYGTSLRLSQSYNASYSTIDSNFGGSLTFNAGVGAGTPTIHFRTNGSEAMRIDSSGNVLVGKTNNALANDGVVIREGGEILATNTSDLSANFNRLSTDGGIVGFYKDGTTVGSIGCYADKFYIGDGDTGICFVGEDDVVLPCSPSSNNNRDNAITLGAAAVRFKDLYLSGGISIGDAKTVGHRDISLKYDLVYMTAGVISPADDDGTDNDNSVDLGKSAARFNDVYATNGTIQTSDRNEKQDIEDLY